MEGEEELKHKIELLERENIQLMTRIIGLREFIFRLSQEIQRYTDSSAFKDILDRPLDSTR